MSDHGIGDHIDKLIRTAKAICPACSYHNWRNYGGKPAAAYWLLPSRTIEELYRI